MIDLFPGMPLETRAYLLLALIGIIFFAGILALGVGNALVNMKRAKEYEQTDAHTAVVSSPKEKPKKSRKSKSKPDKPKREKKSLFGKKKEDKIDMMAVPAGYEPEAIVEETEEEEVVFTPTGVGETLDDELPDDFLTSGFGDNSVEDEDEDEEYLDDWATPPSQETSSREAPSSDRRRNDSSPFGGGVGVDF